MENIGNPQRSKTSPTQRQDKGQKASEKSKSYTLGGTGKQPKQQVTTRAAKSESPTTSTTPVSIDDPGLLQERFEHNRIDEADIENFNTVHMNTLPEPVKAVLMEYHDCFVRSITLDEKRQEFRAKEKELPPEETTTTRTELPRAIDQTIEVLLQTLNDTHLNQQWLIALLLLLDDIHFNIDDEIRRERFHPSIQLICTLIEQHGRESTFTYNLMKLMHDNISTLQMSNNESRFMTCLLLTQPQPQRKSDFSQQVDAQEFEKEPSIQPLTERASESSKNDEKPAMSAMAPSETDMPVVRSKTIQKTKPAAIASPEETSKPKRKSKKTKQKKDVLSEIVPEEKSVQRGEQLTAQPQRQVPYKKAPFRFQREVDKKHTRNAISFLNEGNINHPVNETGLTPLLFLMYNDCPLTQKDIQSMKELGLDLNTKIDLSESGYKYKTTALLHIIDLASIKRDRHTLYDFYTRDLYCQYASLLLQAGADPDIPAECPNVGLLDKSEGDIIELPPICLSILRRQKAIFDTLLANHANPDIPIIMREGSLFPIHLIIDKNLDEFLKALTKAPVNLNARNNTIRGKNRTAIQKLAHTTIELYGEHLDQLVNPNKHPSADKLRDIMKKTCARAKTLKEAGADLDLTDEENKTPRQIVDRLPESLNKMSEFDAFSPQP